MRRRTKNRLRPAVRDPCKATVFGAILCLSLLPFILRRLPKRQRDRGDCRVQPVFLKNTDYDSPEAFGVVPQHVYDFDARGVELPKYDGRELLMVSVSSNNTYSRQIAQSYTFGRIFDITFVTDDDMPSCVLCHSADVDDSCHCPSFRTACREHVFFGRPTGWWCATRKALVAIRVALREWEDGELPEWLHLLDDNTWVNPISERLLTENLDPETPYYIGDDYGGFVAGGPGMLMSRGALRELLRPAVHPEVRYNWKNGTHSVLVDSQLESCIARMQGGDWCYFHGDWALAECFKEVGVNLTDLGSRSHGAFFSQLAGGCENNETWFGVAADVAPLLRRTHSAALHLEPEEMFDIFYTHVVTYYQNLFRAVRRRRQTL